ncbi:MAG: zinc finger domain-containing protein [Roseburia sp.]|nr:zinc finger domain-containing protein [Roseburia sp.]
MKVNKKSVNICPKCGSRYTARAALSRKDNVTYICPKCGTREALETAGVAEDEIIQILEKIYNDED